VLPTCNGSVSVSGDRQVRRRAGAGWDYR